MKNHETIIDIAKECLALEQAQEERPEMTWLRERYECFWQKSGLPGKAEADRLLYQKMYSEVPQKSSDTLKIRYWRTGRHVPTNREMCLDFGRALELDEHQMEYLLLQYYDRCDRIFLEDQSEDPEYKKRKAVMDKVLGEYFIKVHPMRRMQMKISQNSIENNIRHLYYMDALKYVNIPDSDGFLKIGGHGVSVAYGSELNRNLRLFGEIPRKTMIRHLLILGMPYISRKIIDERLIQLGYLPLTAEHTLTGGERLDWLLIRLLECYEKVCNGMEPEGCSRWFQEACRILDEYFEKRGKPNLRFMYFKALRE